MGKNIIWLRKFLKTREKILRMQSEAKKEMFALNSDNHGEAHLQKNRC